jgi:hypothetical protein
MATTFHALEPFKSCLRYVSHVRQLAYVHLNIEGKAVQVKGGAAQEAKFHAPHRRRLKGDPAVESVFARQSAAAGFRRQVKTILAAATLAFSQ